MKLFVTREYLENAQERIAQMQQELSYVRAEKRASFDGDTNTWHDNFAYESLTRQEKQLENQIFSAMRDIKDCVVVSASQIPQSNTVGLYCRVRFMEENSITDTEAEKEITIVPVGGENFAQKHYNYNAPTVLPLMGAKVGDVRSVSIPSGQLTVTILEITPAI